MGLIKLEARILKIRTVDLQNNMDEIQAFVPGQIHLNWNIFLRPLTVYRLNYKIIKFCFDAA